MHQALYPLALPAITASAVGAGVIPFLGRRLAQEIVLPAWSRKLLDLGGIQVRIRGEKPVDGRQYIYIANHRSTLDIPVLAALPLINCRFFITGPYNHEIKPLAPILRSIGCIFMPPQSRPESRRRVFQQAAELLSSTGESAFLTPEGKRIPSGRIGHFNKGSFHLAQTLGCPIVPIYIRTPDDLNPGRGYRSQAAGFIDVCFGEPVETDLEVPPSELAARFQRYYEGMRTRIDAEF